MKTIILSLLFTSLLNAQDYTDLNPYVKIRNMKESVIYENFFTDRITLIESSSHILLFKLRKIKVGLGNYIKMEYIIYDKKLNILSKMKQFKTSIKDYNSSGIIELSKLLPKSVRVTITVDANEESSIVIDPRYLKLTKTPSNKFNDFVFSKITK